MERIGRFDGTDRVGRGRACDAAPTPQPNAPLAWSSRRVHSPDLLRPVSHAASPPHLLTCGLPPPQPPIPLPATTHRTATPPTCTAAESTSTRRSTGEGSTGGGLPLAPRARETSFHEPLRCMPGTARGALHVSPRPPLRGRNRGAPVCRRDVASPDGPDAPHPAAEPLAGAGEGYHLSEALAPPTRRGYLKGTQGPRRTLAWHRSPPCVACPALLLARPADTVRDLIPMPATTDRDDGHQRQCRRVGSADVELHAAMALADMAGVDHPPPAQHHHHAAAAAVPQATTEHEDEELASTRLSLELGNVGIQSSPCSSSSSGAGQHQPLQAASSAAALPGYGPNRPRSMLTEAEKEAKRLRRVLANRESARQTILRRQAIRDELARKVADLASQNENMKKEKDMVLEQYMSLKETNKQLKQQVAKTTKKKPSSTPATTPMDIVSSAQHAEAASPPPTPPQPSFLYSGPPPTMPVPYVWGSWPPCGPGAYEHGGSPAGAAGHVPPPLCLPPACAWYYPVVTAADPRGSPTSYVQPFQEPTGSPGGGGGTAGEETDDDDDPCSLTLAIDAAADNKKSTNAGANSHQTNTGVVGAVGLRVAPSSREKAATAAEARRRRKELTKLKQMHGGSRHAAGDHW